MSLTQIQQVSRPTFLLDQGLPRSTVAELARRGFAAEHVGDLGMSRAADREILAEARTRGAVVVALDADFHMLLAITQAHAPSVIRIRRAGLKGTDVAELLEAVTLAAFSELMSGAAVTVTVTGIRIRLLPLA